MDYLDQIYFNNTVKSYLIVTAIILVARIIKHYLSRFIASLIFVVVKKRSWKLDRDIFVSHVIQPLGNFIFLLIAFSAIGKLTFPDALKFKIYSVTSEQILASLAIGVLIYTFIKLVLSIVEFIAMLMEARADLTVTQSDNQLIMFFKDFLRVVIIIIGIMMILKFSFGAHIGEMLTGLSIVGAALALAARESLENLIASFIIFFDKPFTAGDIVKVQNFTGTVERIGLRSTRIRTADKNMVTVPNKQMVDSILDNQSMRTLQRMELRFELSFKTPAEKLTTVINEMVKIVESKGERVINHSVFLVEVSKNGNVVVLEYFSEAAMPASEFNKLRQEINMEVKILLEKNQIEMAGGGSSINIIDGGAQPAKSSPII